MVIKVFVSRTPGNPAIKQEQAFIRRVLDCKNIAYEEVDIADPLHSLDKELMYRTVRTIFDGTGQAVALERHLARGDLPPQLFNGDKYRGGFNGFYNAVENETLFQYLALEVPSNEVEYKRLLRSGNSPTTP